MSGTTWLAVRSPVVDAKYKAEKPTGFPGADLYQLLAYCTVLDLPDGHLVYAKGEAEHASHTVQTAGLRIHQHALDLEQPPDAILSQLEKIAELCSGNPSQGSPISRPAAPRG